MDGRKTKKKKEEDMVVSVTPNAIHNLSSIGFINWQLI